MSKIFETNFENGSLIDKVSNNIGVFTGNGLLAKTVKGYTVIKNTLTYSKKFKDKLQLAYLLVFIFLENLLMPT